MENLLEVLELDELHWYVSHKRPEEARQNVYLMTAVSRKPRKIVGFDVAFDKSAEPIQCSGQKQT